MRESHLTTKTKHTDRLMDLHILVIKEMLCPLIITNYQLREKFN